MMLHRMFVVVMTLLLTSGPALAHSDPDYVKTRSFGALSFIASTGLSVPINGNTYSSPVTVTPDSDHYVAISAFGGGGTSVNIDYQMALTAEGNLLPNAFGQTNYNAGLDVTGYWEQAWAGGNRSATLSVGGRIIGCEAWIGFGGSASSRISALHTHNITVN